MAGLATKALKESGDAPTIVRRCSPVNPVTKATLPASFAAVRGARRHQSPTRQRAMMITMSPPIITSGALPTAEQTGRLSNTAIIC